MVPEKPISTVRVEGRSSVYRMVDDPVAGLSDLVADREAVAVIDLGLHDAHPEIRDRLQAAGCAVVGVPGGERVKNLAWLERLFEVLATLALSRRGVLIGVGGGATLDLVGLAAATWRRGVDWIAVPSTLLAQVDAAIGGKTAVNAAGLKNPVGAFHPPEEILAAPHLLATLPRRHWSSGLAELVKTAVIDDTDLFSDLETSAPVLRTHLAAADRNATASGLLEAMPWRTWIAAAARVKGSIVARDFREAGPRAALNLGHTLGHVLEASADDTGRQPDHGEAVAIGMLVAFRLAVARGLCPPGDWRRVAGLLEAGGLPTAWPAPSQTTVAALLRGDKKSRGETLDWVLPAGIGRVLTRQRVDVAEAWQALAAGPGLPPTGAT